MKKDKEFFIGLILLAVFIYALSSADKLIDFLILCALYAFVIFLWQRNSTTSKFFAVLLLPLLVLRVFLPKRTKDIIKQIKEIENARNQVK